MGQRVLCRYGEWRSEDTHLHGWGSMLRHCNEARDYYKMTKFSDWLGARLMLILAHYFTV